MTRVAPAKVRKEAKLGLELHKKWKRGGTVVGVARAVQLSSGKAVSDAVIKRMYSYFQRHQHDRLDKDGSDGSIPGRGYIAWLLWGGHSGRKWAESEYKKLKKEKNPITKPVKKIKEDLAKKTIYLIKVSLDDYRSEPWAQEMVTKEEDFEVVDNYDDDGEPIFKTSEYVFSVVPKKYLQDFEFLRRMQMEGKLEKHSFTSAARAWLENDQPLDWFNEQAQDRGYLTKDEYLFLVKVNNPLKLIARGIDPRPASNYNREELKLGLKTELEHTDDAIIASKIAKDHLDEDPKYYSKLVEMEKGMKKNPLSSTEEKTNEYLPIVTKSVENNQKSLNVWVDDDSNDILVGTMAFEEDRSFDDVLIRIKTTGQMLEGESVDNSIRKSVQNLMKKIHKDLVEYVSRKKSNPVPAGVDPKEFDDLVKKLKKRKDVDNPYALANWILTHKKGNPIPEKYLKGSTDRKERKKEIEKNLKAHKKGESKFSDKDWVTDFDESGERIETVPSQYTEAFKKKYNPSSLDKAIKNKAKECGVPLTIARAVVKRGQAAWASGHRPGTTPEQWGLARLNSFCVGGKTTKTADQDLFEKWKKKTR
jgi:hypothetical protein